MKILFILICLTYVNFSYATSKVSICKKKGPLTLSPVEVTSNHDRDGTFLKIYEPLIKRSARKKIILPLLVSKWLRDRSKNTWTFYLKDQVSFHSNKYFKPSRFMNADDVKFSFDLLMKSDSTISKTLSTMIKKINIINKQTVEFMVKNDQDGNFFELLLNYGMIMSKEYYDMLNEQGQIQLFHKKPIGTGPFLFDKFKKNHYLKFTKFNKYHLGNVLLNNLEIITVFNSTKLPELIKFGACDIIYGPTTSLLNEVKKLKDISIKSTDPLYLVELKINTNDEIVQSLNIPKIIKSINLKQYNKDFFFNIAKIETDKDFPKELSINNKNTPPQKNIIKKIQILTVISKTVNKRIPNLKKFIKRLQFDLSNKELKVKAYKVSKQKMKQTLNDKTFQIALTINPIEKVNKSRSSAYKSIPLFKIGKMVLMNNKVKNYYLTNDTLKDYSTINVLNKK